MFLRRKIVLELSKNTSNLSEVLTYFENVHISHNMKALMENRALVTHFSEATAPIHTEIQVIYKSTYQELLQDATGTIWFSARF